MKDSSPRAELNPEMLENNPTPQSAAALRAKLARQLDEPSSVPIAPRVPDHTLLRCIGEGACGEVWLARTALGTLRAVKLVYRSRFKENRPYEREFEGILKYEPISRTHEGLVQVLHVGRDNQAGYFYYVMELADPMECSDKPGDSACRVRAGFEPHAASNESYRPRTLSADLALRQRLSPGSAAQLVLRIAQALAHLHEHGLVHRDIKPGNVIFVAGRPKLADIGLVTDVGSSRSFVGTEGFIPPEGPGTPQADIYALGKLLYELVSGGDRLDFPRLPSDIAMWPDSDREAYLELNEVMSRACAPEPAWRYAAATQIQAELDLFLAGRSLRRARNLERAVARLKQFAGAACVLLVLAAGALWFSMREERHARDRFQAESTLRRRAEAAEQESKDKLYAALLEQARATVRSGDLGQRVRALDALRRAAAISNSVELRREALAAVALPDLRQQRELAMRPDHVVRSLDPSFERIALCQGRGPVEIRAVADDRVLATLPASTNLMCYGVTWSRDGRFLAVKRDYPPSGVRSDLEVWRVDESRLVLMVYDVNRNARTFHPDNTQLATASPEGEIVVWDLETGTKSRRSNLGVIPENLAYSPEGDRIAASHRVGGEGVISIHRMNGNPIVSCATGGTAVTALDWHRGGRWVAATDYDGAVHILDSQTGELRTLGRHKAEATTLVFSPEGSYLLTGGWERELICWDLLTMQRSMTIAVDSYIAQFRADSQACALFTPGAIQFHAFEHPSAHRRFTEDLGPRLRHGAFSPDGRRLAASGDGTVGVWDLHRGGPATVVAAGSETHFFWTSDGSELFGSCRNQTAFRWRVAPGTNGAAPLRVEPLALAVPEGFVSLDLASNQIVWTAARGDQATASMDGVMPHDTWIDTFQRTSGASPESAWLAIFRPYGTVLRVHQLPGLRPVAWLTNAAPIAGFSISPSGKEIGVGSRGRVQFWSTATWELVRAATNFNGLMDVGMLYQPDERAVWLARDYRTAGLFDARTLEPLFLLPPGRLPLALSADGRQLAVSVDAQRLEVWDLEAVREHFRKLGLDSPAW